MADGQRPIKRRNVRLMCFLFICYDRKHSEVAEHKEQLNTQISGKYTFVDIPFDVSGNCAADLLGLPVIKKANSCSLDIPKKCALYTNLT